MVVNGGDQASGTEMGLTLKLWRVFLGNEHLFNRPSTSPTVKVSKVHRTSPADAPALSDHMGVIISRDPITQLR